MQPSMVIPVATRFKPKKVMSSERARELISADVNRSRVAGLCSQDNW